MDRHQSKDSIRVYKLRDLEVIEKYREETDRKMDELQNGKYERKLGNELNPVSTVKKVHAIVKLLWKKYLTTRNSERYDEIGKKKGKIRRTWMVTKSYSTKCRRTRGKEKSRTR